MKWRLKLWRLFLFDRAMDLIAYPVWLAGSPATAQQRAFRFAKRVAPWLERLRGRCGPGAIPMRTILMNRLITRMTRYGNSFPLDIEVHNAAALDTARSEGRGVLIVTMHTFMTLSAHGALRREGLSPLFIGNEKSDMTGWNWGHPTPLKGIDAHHPATLLRKLDAALKEGRTVVSFVDFTDQRKSDSRDVLISPNLFAWAHARQVPMLYMFTYLDETGKIHLELEEAAAREPAFNASLPAFLEFLSKRSELRFIVQRPRILRQPLAA